MPATAARDLADVTSLEDVQAVVRTSARRPARADGATFVLRDGDACFYADEDAISPLWKGQRFPITDCISGWAMLHGETVVVPDIHVDPRIPQEAYRPTFVRSLAMVPVRAGGDGDAVAAIGVYWATVGSGSPEAVAAVEALAAAAGSALERFTPVAGRLPSA